MSSSLSLSGDVFSNIESGRVSVAPVVPRIALNLEDIPPVKLGNFVFFFSVSFFFSFCSFVSFFFSTFSCSFFSDFDVTKTMTSTMIPAKNEEICKHGNNAVRRTNTTSTYKTPPNSTCFENEVCVKEITRRRGTRVRLTMLHSRNPMTSRPVSAFALLTRPSMESEASATRRIPGRPSHAAVSEVRSKPKKSKTLCW